MVEEADVQETTKLFDVISVTDSEVSTNAGSWVVSPSDVSTGVREGGGGTFLSLNLRRGEAFRECYHSSLLTRTMGSGEIEARDLAPSVGKEADQLALVGDSRTQPTDGVGVHVTRDCNLCPGIACIFLEDKEVVRFKIYFRKSF